MVHAPFTGVVLTGGRSTRMGRDKALLVVDGVPLASRVARALVEAGASEVIAVGGDLERLERLDHVDRVVPDALPDQGPLGGILTALDASSNDLTVVLACDTPKITSQTPAALVTVLDRHPDVAVAVAVQGGRVHPLTAAWRRTLAGTVLRSAFESGERAPRRVLEALSVMEVGTIPESGILDVDRPEDLDRYAAGADTSTE